MAHLTVVLDGGSGSGSAVGAALGGSLTDIPH